MGQFDENRACALNILTPLLANHKEHRSRTKYGLIERQEEVISFALDQRFSIFTLRENYVFVTSPHVTNQVLNGRYMSSCASI